MRPEPGRHGRPVAPSTRSACSARPGPRGAARCRRGGTRSWRRRGRRSNGIGSGRTPSTALPGARTFGCWPTSGRRVLRTDGLPAFAHVLTTASQWLETYWPQVYPLLDEDAIARRNALNCFADPMAVVDRVWRLPLVASRQHGRFSLRDIDIARGQASPGPTEETGRTRRRSREAFAAIPLEELTALDLSVADGDGRAEQHRRADARRGRPRGRAGFRGRSRRSSPSWRRCAATSWRGDRATAPPPARRAAEGDGRRRHGSPAARSRRARTRFARWTPSRTTSVGTSRRARFRCSSIGRSGWWRRIFSKCWPTSRPTPFRWRGRPAG